MRGTADERQVYIRLTDVGRELQQSARAIPTEIFCAPGSNIDTLLGLRGDLIRLRAALNEHLDQ